MSGINATSGGYGIMPTLLANTASVKQQLDTLTEQASSGLVSQTYAGLGSDAAVTLDLSPHIATLQAEQNNIGQATASMQVTQTAMTQLQQIAATFVADIPNLNGLNASEVDNIASDANQALQQVADLLNTTDGSNNYVFAGQDSTNPPIPNAADILTSGFYTQINQAVAALGTNGAAATIQTTLSVASSNASGTTPFSPYLSQPAGAIGAPVVQTGDGSTVQTGLLANANLVPQPSTDTSTTGSYMRDLMRALATLGSLSASQINDPGFSTLVADTGASLNGVVTGMAVDDGVLGNTQSNLTAVQTQLSDTRTALTAQVSNVQDTDMAATLSNLTAIQTQLQASYRLITEQSSLSLVTFLPATA